MHLLKHWLSALCITLVMTMVLLGAPKPSYAQTKSDVCTSFTERAGEVYKNGGVAKDGLLTNIYHFIKDVVNTATKKLFDAFINNSEYKLVVGAAITLMVLFYGIGFTIGIVQPSFQQVLIRLLKIAIISALIAPGGGWAMFNQYVVGFFQDGSDDLIVGVQAIGFGMAAPANASPFFALDRMAEFLIQPDTLIAILGSALNGGPFGLSMAALVGLAMFGFFDLILKTLQVYAISFVARSLMLGIAPIFLLFLLFDKTKNLFVAWLNALINLSLQPILLFTFLSFFLVMMENASKDMLNTKLCWQETTGADGTANNLSFWSFKNSSSLGWNGSLECIMSSGATANPSASTKCPAFPIDIVDVLSFLILVYIARRFSDVVQRISNELSNAFVSLDTQGRFDLDTANNRAGASVNNLTTPAGGQTRKPSGTLPRQGP